MVAKDELTVSVIQTALHWENVPANIAMFDKLLDEAAPADLYVLPEMFTTGFSMKPEVFAEQSYQLGLSWMKAKASEKGAAIVGSLMAPEPAGYHNRLLFVWPGGEHYHYDKRHLFGLGSEPNHYKQGNQLLLVDYLGWKICPLVCYDLRFPVWSRNVHYYDILLYVANWPQRRIHHWRALLPARAVENQCYVAACNRVGVDGNGFEHDGSSMLIDFNGEALAENRNDEKILTATFSKPALRAYRESLPFLADADKFSF